MSFLGRLSRVLNLITGGARGETLCARMARTRGHWCWFCRVVGWLLNDPRHCWNERISEIRKSLHK